MTKLIKKQTLQERWKKWKKLLIQKVMTSPSNATEESTK